MADDEPLADFIPEGLRAALRSGELRLARPRMGQRFGHHASRRAGQGLEFRDHRPYSPGDDLRRLDWRAFARRDRPVIRQTEAETELDLRLLIDAGANMDYGEGWSHKWAIARSLAGALALLASGQGDRVGFALGHGDAVDAQYLKPRSTPSQVRALASSANVEAAGVCPWRELVRRTATGLRPRSLLVLLSDFWDLAEHAEDDADRAAEDLFEGLSRIVGRGHDVVMARVVHRDELEFPWDEAQVMTALDPRGMRSEVEGPERTLRTPYIEAIARYNEALQRRADRIGARLITLISDDEPGASLLRLLAAIAGAPDPAAQAQARGGVSA